MNSSSRGLFRLCASFSGLLLADVPAIQAQGLYFMSKSQGLFQTSGAGPVVHPTQPYNVSVQAASNVTFTLPGGGTAAVPFVASNSDYEINQSFATKDALDAAFPNGIYRMTGTGIPALSLNLGTESYPTAVPQVTSGGWNSGGLLVVNPAQTTTINFSTFTGYSTNSVGSHMSLSVQGLFDNVRLKNDIATQAVFGLTFQAAPLTSITIPAGTLTSGRVYDCQIVFDTLTTLDTTTVPGGGVVAIFSKGVEFYIAAQNAGTVTPPPVIIGQPVSQTAVLGGSATFNIGVNVGGSAPTGNLQVLWSFNGQQLNIDGSKYTFSNTGAGLVVKNITAADVGNYTATLINAGGIVTSAPAALSLGVVAPPTISRQPASQTVANGSTVVFSVTASGTPAPTYQWLRGSSQPGAGTPALIPGATSATLVLSGPSGNNAALAGTYSVVVTNSAGSVTSSPATLALVPTNDPGRLTNLSVLTDITGDVSSFTVGTVIGGAGTTGGKSLVVRAAGPSLGALGVPGTIGDPKLDFFSGQTVIASNDNWGSDATVVPTLTNAMASVGAFAFTGPNSKDAAVFLQNLSGGYTVQVSGVNGSTGTAIAEIYDATPVGTFTLASPRLINVSVLKQIANGGSLTLGFTVSGSTAKTVLIRVIGPGLAAVGVNSGTLGDPQLTLFNSSSAVIASNDDWGADPQVSAAGSRVNAFSIGNQASKDSMLIVTLPAGGYTAQAKGNNGTSGLAIVEVYEVP